MDPTEKLQGSKNYVLWAEKIKRILLADGVDDYVTKKLEEINDEPVIRDRINAAVYELIHTNLIPEIQPLITNIPRALDAWKKLEKSYTSNSVDEIVASIDQFRELAFDLNKPVPSFFAECELTFMKLDRLGVILPTVFKTNYIISILYTKLPNVASQLTNLPQDQITLDVIQEKVTKEIELQRRRTQKTEDPRPTSGYSTS